MKKLIALGLLSLSLAGCGVTYAEYRPAPRPVGYIAPRVAPLPPYRPYMVCRDVVRYNYRQRRYVRRHVCR